MTKHPWLVTYVVCQLALLALPVCAIPWAPHDDSAELQTLASWPAATAEDGAPNRDYLRQAGEWLDDHFAFRQQAITANARIQADLFQTSPTAQVVVGSDGWLFYGGTTDDYQRTESLSDDLLANAAQNLALAQEYVQGQGAAFTVAIAPDKNGVDGSAMPYQIPEGEGPSSVERLQGAMAAQGVSHVDLHGALKAVDGPTYLKTDSHWNVTGIRQVLPQLLGASGVADPHRFDAKATAVEEDFVGDLEAMLYPLGRTPEPREYLEGCEDFTYLEGQGPTDDTVACASTALDAQGSLVMYRDSFSNFLIPPLATTFAQSYYSKLIPYDLTQVPLRGATAVIVERAQRHLDFFATDPAIFPAPLRQVDPALAVDPGVPVSIEAAGGYTKFSGAYGQDRDRPAHVYLSVTGDGETRWYEASRVSVHGEKHRADSDDGFSLYIPSTDLPQGAVYGVVLEP